MIEIRPYREGDAAGCGALFHRAVHEGAAGHYSAEQRAAWAPYPVLPPDVEARFDQRLSGQITWVAEEDGSIEGFMSLRQDGYVDYAYVAPERMGTGLAGELYKKIKASARKLSLNRLTTEASHLARPFFERRGWELMAAQHVERQGVLIPNFKMKKDL